MSTYTGIACTKSRFSKPIETSFRLSLRKPNSRFAIDATRCVPMMARTSVGYLKARYVGLETLRGEMNCGAGQRSAN
jgi:hypothetical protein